MSNLVKVEQLPLGELMNMAKMFAESGMFQDVKGAAQAIVKIQAGQEIGIPPFAAMSGIHIIKGKPTIGAGLIASRIKGSGKYDYRVVQQDDKACVIDFYQGKEKIGTSTFTIDDAKKAQTQNIDKFARNMLFARAISNGVKWYCPDVFAGPVYVPEEMEQITEDVSHEEVKPVQVVKKTLTDKAVDQAATRIKAGEPALYQNILEAYELTETQKATLDAANAAPKDDLPR